ncbi:hypothetical protein FOCC_FOCC006322, partial [Frankliniella occidentalis]
PPVTYTQRLAPPPPPPTTTRRPPPPPSTYLPPVTTTTTRRPPPPPPPPTTRRPPPPPSTYLPPVTQRTTTPAPEYLPPVEINLKKVDKDNNFQFVYNLPEVSTRRVIPTTTTTTPKPSRDYLPPEDNIEGLELLPEFVNPPKPKPKPKAEDDGQYNDPNDDPTKWNLRDSIPGEPGKDYPTLREIPTTDFSCEGRADDKSFFMNDLIGKTINVAMPTAQNPKLDASRLQFQREFT